LWDTNGEEKKRQVIAMVIVVFAAASHTVRASGATLSRFWLLERDFHKLRLNPIS